MPSIRLHPKFGVNPTLAVCFFCGQQSGDILLLGDAYKGEAPRQKIANYQPCDTCKAQMAAGITLIEAIPADDKHPAMVNGLAPTGRWWVITEDALGRLPITDTFKEQARKSRKMMLQPEVAKLFGLYDPDATAS